MFWWLFESRSNIYKNEPKWGEPQAGRPGLGLPLQHFVMKLHGGWLEPKIMSHQCGFGKFHKTRPKGLNQVELSPNPTTTRRFRTQLNLRSNVGLERNMTEKQKPEPSQIQTGRPRRSRPASNCLRWSHTTATDFWRRSRASLKGGGQVATSLGRPAEGRPANPTWQPLMLFLGVKDKHN